MIIFPLQRCPPSSPPMKLLNTTNTYWWMDVEWMRKNDDDDFHTQSYVCVVWAKAQFKRSFHDAHPGISSLFKRYPSSPLTLLDQYYTIVHSDGGWWMKWWSIPHKVMHMLQSLKHEFKKNIHDAHTHLPRYPPSPLPSLLN
jgi:hypothetical protein